MSTITPPGFTAWRALSRAFWVWYRFRSLGAPPWLTRTMSAPWGSSLRYSASRKAHPARWAFTGWPATARMISLCSLRTTLRIKSMPQMAPASSISIRRGLVSNAPAQASGRTIIEWLDWMASRVDTPGMMALAPPEYPAK